jgi:hypothetical protein
MPIYEAEVRLSVVRRVNVAASDILSAEDLAVQEAQSLLGGYDGEVNAIQLVSDKDGYDDDATED